MGDKHLVLPAVPVALAGTGVVEVARAESRMGSDQVWPPLAQGSSSSSSTALITPSSGTVTHIVPIPVTTIATTAGKQWFDEGQVSGVGKFLGDKSKSSIRRYEEGWKRWGVFLGTLPEERRPDIYLTQMGTDKNRATIMALFVQHLYEHPLNLRGKKLTSMITHVKGYFAARPPLSTTFFDSATVKTARKCAAKRVWS
jgi:hypothetical protein